MDKAKALLVVPLWLLAILGLLMGALRLTINRPGYFSNIYEEMDTQSRIGISPADCTDAMMAMIGYMEGSRDSIQLTVTEYGRQVQMFNQQEIDHMVDVRALYQTFRDLGDVGLASLGLFLIGMAAWSRWPGAFPANTPGLVGGFGDLCRGAGCAGGICGGGFFGFLDPFPLCVFHQ